MRYGGVLGPADIGDGKRIAANTAAGTAASGCQEAHTEQETQKSRSHKLACVLYGDTFVLTDQSLTSAYGSNGHSKNTSDYMAYKSLRLESQGQGASIHRVTARGPCGKDRVEPVPSLTAVLQREHHRRDQGYPTPGRCGGLLLNIHQAPYEKP